MATWLGTFRYGDETILLYVFIGFVSCHDNQFRYIQLTCSKNCGVLYLDTLCTWREQQTKTKLMGVMNKSEHWLHYPVPTERDPFIERNLKEIPVIDCRQTVRHICKGQQFQKKSYLLAYSFYYSTNDLVLVWLCNPTFCLPDIINKLIEWLIAYHSRSDSSATIVHAKMPVCLRPCLKNLAL